jgi:hypothetical protein
MNPYINEEIRTGIMLPGRLQIWAEAADATENYLLDWLEFGVRKGKSATHLLGMMYSNQRLSLFDSFEGLPEDWHLGDSKNRAHHEFASKGTFACEPPTFSDKRVSIYKGWFSETLPQFTQANPNLMIGLLHLDCDIYTSTKEPGTVLLFDDMHGYPNWLEGQWKAFQEWRGSRNIEWLAYTPGLKRGKNVCGQAAVRIL